MLCLLQNEHNKNVMDLEDGDWKYGRVQVTTQASDDMGKNTPSTRNQRWLLSKIPGSTAYTIFNLFYGVPLGVFYDERSNGSFSCKTGPCSVQSVSMQWHVKEAGQSYWFISWGGDQDRVLDVPFQLSGGGVTANTKRDPYDAAKIQHWLPLMDTKFHRSSNALATWMSNIPDDTKLSHMSLPGTHQSLALHGALSQGGNSHGRNLLISDNPRCQNRSPYEQLVDGIRVLDLRFDRWIDHNSGEKDCLFARHGNALGGLAGINEGYSLLAVLHTLKDFLLRYSRETVIVNLDRETNTDGFFKAFDNDFSVFFRNSKFIWYHSNSAVPDMSTLKLGDVRGRAIIVSDFLQQVAATYQGVHVFMQGKPFQCSSDDASSNRNRNEDAYNLYYIRTEK